MTKAHTEQTEALQKAGAIALRLSRSGDKQAAASIRALLARVQGLEASQARVPLSEEAEQAEMYRWLRDHYHGFEHYRTDFAKTLGLFERDIKKQMAITQEQQG